MAKYFFFGKNSDIPSDWNRKGSTPTKAEPRTKTKVDDSNTLTVVDKVTGSKFSTNKKKARNLELNGTHKIIGKGLSISGN